MHKYKVVSAISLFSGIVLLDKRQADARKHAVEHLGDESYLINARVDFKIGEVIGFEGEPDKSLLAMLEPFEDEESRKKAKAAERAKAKAEDDARLKAKADADAKAKADADAKAKADADAKAKADADAKAKADADAKQGGGQQNGGEQ